VLLNKYPILSAGTSDITPIFISLILTQVSGINIRKLLSISFGKIQLKKFDSKRQQTCTLLTFITICLENIEHI
jgi:hypothetical protein